ncbi:mucin-binding protein [Fructobacillus durionis]|uniref:Mub B2-like domain-containing protein n=1 Tax=Fructobacillus durionis TaxID=283737 RepID=A0A1I1ECT3_9LACO|nr:hypothetical protein [Fructobacillus durionis]SFB82723.1 hypothetical protein SAMN05660453_0328 [Fructobacillus durionis]
MTKQVNQKHSTLTKKIINGSFISATLAAGIFFTNTSDIQANAAETNTSSSATQSSNTHTICTITPNGYYIGNAFYSYGTNGINLPSNVKQFDFYRTYTRTIRYVDAGSNTEVAKTVQQSVSLVRWGTYDYTTNQMLNWGTYSASKDGNPVGDSIQFNKQDSPDLTSEGLELTGASTVDALPITPSTISSDNSSDPVVTVYYKHKTRAVNTSDNAVTQKVTTRQINLVNSTGQVIGQTTQKVTFNRSALYYDEYSKQVVYSDWEANVGTGSDWASYAVPTSVTYENNTYSDPDLTTIEKEVVNAATSDSTITVTYQKSAASSDSSNSDKGSDSSNNASNQSNNTDSNSVATSSNSSSNDSKQSSETARTDSTSTDNKASKRNKNTVLPSTAASTESTNYSLIMLALATSAVLTVTFFTRSSK